MPDPSPPRPAAPRAVRRPPGRAALVRALAALMREASLGLDGALTEEAARAAGFTAAEIAACRDGALALLRRDGPLAPAPAADRSPGEALVRQARAIRRRAVPPHGKPAR